MTIEKKYMIKNKDTIKVIYIIKVGFDSEDYDVELGEVIEYIIKSKEDLAKIPEFEEQAKKREEELKEKVMRLKEIVDELEKMGYEMVEEEVEEVNGRDV